MGALWGRLFDALGGMGRGSVKGSIITRRVKKKKRRESRAEKKDILSSSDMLPRIVVGAGAIS